MQALPLMILSFALTSIAPARTAQTQAISTAVPQSRAVAPLTVNIAQFGARPDGKTDCAPAFRKAFASGAKIILVPPGTFPVSKITLPDGVTVEGVGDHSVLTPAPHPATPLVTLGNDTTLRRLKFAGGAAKTVCLRSGPVKHVRVQDVTIENFTDIAIETDHTEDMVIEGCSIARVRRATNLVFSRRIKVLNNTIDDCTEHGLQFWGNWKWESQESSELQFIGNTLKNAGAGAIWGAGARRVVIAQNLVDGAEDVGIDLEWCADATITGNVVERAKNGGIALFFSCQRVSITGNTILNNRLITADEAKADWWVRSGIWLTYPNLGEFKNDHGHRDISLTGNTIVCADGTRRAVWIGTGSDNVTLGGNTIQGGKLWKGGGSKPLVETRDNVVIRDAQEQ